MARTEAQYSNQGYSQGYQRNIKRAYVDFQGVETDPNKLRARQLQIDIGKQTPGYKEYIRQVKKEMRRRNWVMPPEPHTPDPHIKCSKRFFDGQIKKWRRDLHWYDPRNWEEEQYGTGELKPRGQSASAARHIPEVLSQASQQQSTPPLQSGEFEGHAQAFNAPPALNNIQEVPTHSLATSKQVNPLSDITNDTTLPETVDNSHNPFADESLRNLNWADDTADDTALDGIPGGAPHHLRPIRTNALPDFIPGDSSKRVAEGDYNDKENNQQRSASLGRGNASSNTAGATGASTATSDHKGSGQVAWEKLTSSTNEGQGSVGDAPVKSQKESLSEAEKKAAVRRLVPDKLVQMQRQALIECVTIKPREQGEEGSWSNAGTSSRPDPHASFPTGHYARALAGPPAAPLKEQSYRPNEPRLRGRGIPSYQQSWDPSVRTAGLPPGYILEVDKERTAEILQAAGVRDPKRFVSEADKERLRLLRGEPNYLQETLYMQNRGNSAPRQPRPIPIEVPTQAELPGFRRTKTPWSAAKQPMQATSMARPSATVYQQYDGLTDNDFLPAPSEARVDDSAAARYRIRSKTPQEQVKPSIKQAMHNSTGRSSSVSIPSNRSSVHSAATNLTLATESLQVAESLSMTEVVEDDASFATRSTLHRPHVAPPSATGNQLVSVSFKVYGDQVRLLLRQSSQQPHQHGQRRSWVQPRGAQNGGRQGWSHGFQQGFRSRSAGPLQQLPEQPRVRVFQAGLDELQSVQPVSHTLGLGLVGMQEMEESQVQGVKGLPLQLIAPALRQQKAAQEVVRVSLPVAQDGVVGLQVDTHTRKRYSAEILTQIFEPDLSIPFDLDRDLPRGHALKELFSKYNMRRQKPGRRIAPVSVANPVAPARFSGRNAVWAPTEIDSQDQDFLRDPLARRMAGMAPLKGRLPRKQSLADQVDTWRSAQPSKRRIQPQQIAQDQSLHNPRLTQAPFLTADQPFLTSFPIAAGNTPALDMECSAEALSGQANGKFSSTVVDGSQSFAFQPSGSVSGFDLDCDDTAHDLRELVKAQMDSSVGYNIDMSSRG